MKCLSDGMNDADAAHTVYEYLGETNLAQYIEAAKRENGPRKLLYDDFVRIGTQLLEGLALVQSKLVHRNINPENIMIQVGEGDRVNATFIDLKFMVPAGQRTRIAYPMTYPPPEVIDNFNAYITEHRPDSLFDVFLLGSSLFEVLCGHSFMQIALFTKKHEVKEYM